MAHRHTYKVKDGYETKDLTSAKAIRAKCMECSNFSFREVRDCAIYDCALWPFRMGKTGIKRKKKGE